MHDRGPCPWAIRKLLMMLADFSFGNSGGGGEFCFGLMVSHKGHIYKGKEKWEDSVDNV
jgi:hypothetical protein